MTICYFGIYDPLYSRNRIFIKGLRQNGVEVIECRSTKKGISKYIDLCRKHWAMRNSYDAMVVGFSGQQATILAYFLTSKPILFDALTSLYDSLVCDRKLIKKYSLKAAYYWFLDWLSCRVATKIICDTSAHADYFSKAFHIDRSKFVTIFIGSDDDVITPIVQREKSDDSFTVHFHGFFNPLQGVAYILGAAKLLKEEHIKFNIIGSGQGRLGFMKEVAENNLSAVRFIPPVPYEELREYMSQADVCLGIFGTSAKARRVIPNKVFEALAARMPLITSRTEGIGELLVDREHALLCDINSSESLAEKILELKHNPDLRTTIAENGYRLFLEKLQPKMLSRQLESTIEAILVTDTR